MILLCFTFGFCLRPFVWTSKMQGLSVVFTAYIPIPVIGRYKISINNMCWVKEWTQSTDFKKEKTITEGICVFVYYSCVITYCDSLCNGWEKLGLNSAPTFIGCVTLVKLTSMPHFPHLKMEITVITSVLWGWNELHGMCLELTCLEHTKS